MISLLKKTLNVNSQSKLENMEVDFVHDDSYLQKLSPQDFVVTNTACIDFLVYLFNSKLNHYQVKSFYVEDAEGAVDRFMESTNFSGTLVISYYKKKPHNNYSSMRVFERHGSSNCWQILSTCGAFLGHKKLSNKHRQRND